MRATFIPSFFPKPPLYSSGEWRTVQARANALEPRANMTKIPKVDQDPSQGSSAGPSSMSEGTPGPTSAKQPSSKSTASSR